MPDYIEVPQEAVADRLDELILAARLGHRVVIKKDGKAVAFIRPANPNMTEDAYDALIALKRLPRIHGVSDEQVRAWVTEDQR
ncbi:hypothetical protein D3C87_1409920 [compost metagenome]